MLMLDLQFNPIARFYSAPLQMKANNGVFIVDDFGRQKMPPERLLNRWIVPLDRGIDFLTLAGGRKFEIPFDVLVVFATNLDPATLAELWAVCGAKTPQEQARVTAVIGRASCRERVSLTV